MGERATTLTMQTLTAYRNQGSGVRQGRYLRFFCPIHGSDKQRSLRLDPDSGHFRCFQCDAWGYLEANKQAYFDAKQTDPKRPNTTHTPRDRKFWHSPPTNEPIWNSTSPPSKAHKHTFKQKKQRSSLQSTHPKEKNVPTQKTHTRPKPPRPSVLHVACHPEQLKTLQSMLHHPLSKAYLEQRRISLTTAKNLGLGYAPSGQWPHQKDQRFVRQTQEGRLVFPHTTPDGALLNLYGRAVEVHTTCSKSQRHDHLPGSKGIFNARALTQPRAYICEGPFDALSLVEAGYPHSCAIFGLYGLRWEWVQAHELVFCFDNDQAGQKWQELAWQATLRGIQVHYLPPQIYQGYNDLNELWCNTGVLSFLKTIPHKQAETP